MLELANWTDQHNSCMVSLLLLLLSRTLILVFTVVTCIAIDFADEIEFSSSAVNVNVLFNADGGPAIMEVHILVYHALLPCMHCMYSIRDALSNN